MKAYLDSSRSPWYSLVFILPLWGLYEVLELFFGMGRGSGVINGADAILLGLLSILGVHGWLTAETCLAVGAFAIVFHCDKAHRGKPIKPAYLLGMLLESLVYAVLFGAVVARLVRLCLPGFVLGLNASGMASLGLGTQFMSSLGAGVFEELLFRVIILGGLTWAGVHWCKMQKGLSLTVGVLVSSLLFSAFHYVGGMAYTFTITSFVFRFFAGVVLASIYRVRGFGVAACTHALYDVLLVAQGLI